MPDNDCPICKRLTGLRDGTDPLLVAELRESFVVLGEFQRWRGYTLLLSKRCAPELHALGNDARAAFLDDLAIAAEAVAAAFRPAKLNYELLGNLVPHLHWHLFPRTADEPNRLRPVWGEYDAAAKDPAYRLSPDELASMSESLRAEICRLRGG
jgi:diadenosine tetraphosphate (Ap4A) HIT family hydrolase